MCCADSFGHIAFPWFNDLGSIVLRSGLKGALKVWPPPMVYIRENSLKFDPPKFFFFFGGGRRSSCGLEGADDFGFGQVYFIFQQHFKLVIDLLEEFFCCMLVQQIVFFPDSFQGNYVVQILNFQGVQCNLILKLQDGKYHKMRSIKKIKKTCTK